MVPSIPFGNTEDVIKMGNVVNTGLCGCVYSVDEEAVRIAANLECGSVWINNFEKPTGRTVMRGWKESGWGWGEGGMQGILEVYRARVVHVMRQHRSGRGQDDAR